MYARQIGNRENVRLPRYWENLCKRNAHIIIKLLLSQHYTVVK